MRLCSNSSYYEGVPVLFWPWVFWQLLQVDLWVEETGRSVYGAVDRKTGRVYVDFWADDPNEAKAWRPEDLGELLPNSPLWQEATCPDLYDWRTALSLVHGLAQPDRNPLRRLCCESSSAGITTQTSQSALPLPEI